jgi:hypothetical protein
MVASGTRAAITATVRTTVTTTNSVDQYAYV